jgi:hypothetical protein
MMMSRMISRTSVPRPMYTAVPPRAISNVVVGYWRAPSGPSARLALGGRIRT